MKIIIMIMALVMMSNFAFAQLSVNDESYLKATYELEKLKKQRADLITQRDDEILVETEKYNQSKTLIEETYEASIDAIEQDILNKLSDIDILIGK